MKSKALFLALFVAGLATSIAIASPPPGKGHGNGNGKGAASPSSTTASTTLPSTGKVVLCHRTGKATKWVRISVSVHAAAKRIAKGDVWLQDTSGTCGAAASGGTTTGTTTTTTTTVDTTTTAPATTTGTTTTTP
jgi:hypothetical protein